MTSNGKERTRLLVKQLEQLSNEIITDPDKLKRFIQNWHKGFHEYSLFNTILIYSQNPDATLCAGYRQWGKQNRYVKRGEHGIAILAPAFRKVERPDGEEEETEIVRYFISVYVFDYSQTDGEPLELGQEELINGTPDISYSQLIARFSYPVKEQSYIDGLANGYTDGKQITIASERKEQARIASYLHELAHCELGHFDGHKDIDRAIQELEAEAVSYLACCHLGIENDKARYYIGHWQGDSEKLGHSGSRILRTAESIIRTIEKGEANE